MPRFLEARLRNEYATKGKKGRALDKAVYSTMNSIGAMHGNQETDKGAAMQAQHDKDMAKMRGESHSYDFRRPKRQVVSRYKR